MFALPLLAVLGAACGGGSGYERRDGAAVASVTTDFPQMAGTNQIDGARLPAGQLNFAASDPVATLHVSTADASDVASYYNSGLLAQGWKGGGIGSDGTVAYNIWSKDGRIAIVMVTSGRALRDSPGLLNELDLTPFTLKAGDIGVDESLVYVRYATCAEPTIYDCMTKAFATYAARQ